MRHLAAFVGMSGKNGCYLRRFAGGTLALKVMQNEKSLPGDVAHHPPSGSSGYLKSKLQALRIPFTFTTNTRIAQGVAKYKQKNFGFSKYFLSIRK